MNIFLIGFMGSGKSTLGRELAKNIGYTFFETDAWIEQQEGKTISEIFADHGEPYFREKETQLLSHLQLVDECVIATGGGMPCFADNMTRMNQLGKTIWLDVEENILVDRLKNESDLRPKLSGFDTLEQTVHHLLSSRIQFYEQASVRIKNPNIGDLTLCFLKFEV